MPALKPGNEKKPPPERLVPETFQPPNTVGHFVVDGENWNTLAEKYKIPVEELIYSNFQTNIPEEVNWYLHHYVCCDTRTADGYNWRFSTTAQNGKGRRAGVIYVTPDWNVILAGAKFATRQYVRKFFDTTILRPCPFYGSSLDIPGHHIMTRAEAQDFEVFMMGCAPKRVTEAWARTVHMALDLFCAGLSYHKHNAFPLFGGWDPRGPLPPPMPVAISLLSSLSSREEVVQAPFFDLITQQLPGAGSAAEAAVKSFGMWFFMGFASLRGGATGRVRGVPTLIRGPMAEGIVVSDGYLILAQSMP